MEKKLAGRDPLDNMVDGVRQSNPYAMVTRWAYHDPLMLERIEVDSGANAIHAWAHRCIINMITRRPADSGSKV